MRRTLLKAFLTGTLVFSVLLGFGAPAALAQGAKRPAPGNYYYYLAPASIRSPANSAPASNPASASYYSSAYSAPASNPTPASNPAPVYYYLAPANPAPTQGENPFYYLRGRRPGPRPGADDEYSYKS